MAAVLAKVHENRPRLRRSRPKASRDAAMAARPMAKHVLCTGNSGGDCLQLDHVVNLAGDGLVRPCFCSDGTQRVANEVATGVV